MPLNNSGRIIKSRKVKGGTAHQKNHRWESFTTKISKLNSLDPIRRVRRHDTEAESISTTTSYLKAGLEKWVELNMSEAFVEFSRDILPMCDSLPQIIHFENTIMQKFFAYIERRERESLEPLLELLTDFAHDLGQRFEIHYGKALEMLTSIAGTPQDMAVIEWSFSSLAFMFKYLSKVLVQDLRPTYDLMAPLLGKQRQRPHIARFAAEAMSFLVKKAGAPAHREKALPLITKHAKIDLLRMKNTKEFVLYYHGLMTLFAEAMKGTGINIHTSGIPILRSLFETLDDEDLCTREPSPWMNVISGVLTSMVHHTSCDTFQDILEIVIELGKKSEKRFLGSKSLFDLRQTLLSVRMIGICTGARKGTRVGNWTLPLEHLSSILCSVSKNSEFFCENDKDIDLWNSLLLSVSIALQYAPMDAVISQIPCFMDSVTKEPLAKYFLTFCSYFSKAEPERFRSIALPYFQKFIVAHWSDPDNGNTLSFLLPEMSLSGVVPRSSSKDGIQLPQSWQDHIVSKFERLEASPFPEQASPGTYDRSPTTWHDRCLPKYNALLDVLESTVIHPSTNARIAEILLRKLKLALRPSSSLASEEANFIVGRGFSAFLRMSKGTGGADTALEPLLRAAAPRYIRLPNFLSALLDYELSLNEDPNSKSLSPCKQNKMDGNDVLTSSLIANLATGSHELRLLSMRLLDHIHNKITGSASEALRIMILAEQTPLDLQTARSVSMHIRKLAAMYASQSFEDWVKDAIVSFCFGMLTVKYSQIWEDASVSLKLITEAKSGEETVAKLVFSWLEIPSVSWDGTGRVAESHSDDSLTDFECSNLMKLDQLAADSEFNIKNSRDTMLQKFADAQELILPQPPSARSQALRVLAAVPKIAEKHSRLLVPMFLSWAGKQPEGGEQAEHDVESTISNWTRKDQKTLLEIFGLFLNPRSLFKSDDVHTALLKLLSNGDIQIQKSALKAILVWKNQNIMPYEENLLNLLDEARFKEELGLLLQGPTLIQHEHRPILMPVILRLLYGRSISRKGAASGRQGMESKRLAILRALSIEDIGGFLDISLGDLKDFNLFDGDKLQENAFSKFHLSPRKQVGFTHMVEGVLKEFGTKVIPLTKRLADAVLYCVIHCSRRLQESHEQVHDTSEQEAGQNSLLKVVRQTGLKCLVLFFSNSPEFDWFPYMSTINTEIIAPRLENLPFETAQGISVMLRLFSTWSLHPKLVFFLEINDRILSKVAECLAPVKSKDEVKIFALNIIKNVIKAAREDTGKDGKLLIKEKLLTPNMDNFLTHIGGVLRSHHDLSKDLMETCVDTFSELATFVSASTQARNLVHLSILLINQPSRRVSPKTKGGLLLVLERFVPLYDLQHDPELKDKLYNTITSLFGYFKDKTSREVLSRLLLVYSKTDPVLDEAATICIDLNSFLEGRIDEPDYDRRLKAFNAVNNDREVDFNAREWTPILYNMLYFIRHDEEFGVLSSNSSDGICKFISVAGSATEEHEQFAFKHMLSMILMPALFSGVREPSEVVRREYLKVMAQLISTFPNWPEVSDMYSLLASNDELEASFFNNIIAAGKGRQSSALGQLTATAEKGELNSKNVGQFFIPLIEHFIFDRAEGSDAHNLAAEATTAVGILSGSLEWPQYRAMLRRFIGYIQQKPEIEKQIIRLLGKVIDSLTLAAKDLEANPSLTKEQRSTLATTLPKQQKLKDDLTANILPPLIKFLRNKDDSTVSLRVPVAVIVVRLLKLLPQAQLHETLPGVLTDICHILRSKAQEARDMTRDTLTKICVLLGPSCLGFVLKELRGALLRGYQLHVLSYTIHSILVATTPENAPGDLDYCLPSIVSIIMDDIFGATGQEKDAEEYVSKMKEVKSSKSYDSMELIARTATLGRLRDLVQPIEVLLKEKLNIRMVRKIDELLKRISNGLLKNPASESRDSLIFCYEVIKHVRNSENSQVKAKDDYRLKKYLIQKGAQKSGERGSTTVRTYKLMRFAFDVLRSILKRHDSLRTSANLAGFIPLLGDAVLQAEEEVKIAVFKLLITIVKVPLNFESDGTNLYRVATTEATKTISANPSTTSCISQAALKLLSVILRDRRDIIVKDTVIDTLLARLKYDMTQPEHRHVTFNFLRSILDSKIQTAAVYDTLDYVSTVMVTNDDKDTRDLARGAYFHFLRDYPQNKTRWSKQIGFIVANLSYDREGGRLSILEVIHLLLTKSAEDFVQEVSAATFIPLIFVLANDDSEKCRVATGEVLKTIFVKADNQKLNAFMTILRSWINQKDNRLLHSLAFQVFGFFYESIGHDGGYIPMLLKSILETIQTAGEKDSDWEQIYVALQLTIKLTTKFPETLFLSKQKQLWAAICLCLSYTHAWVKLSAAKLISNYFADFAHSNMANSLKGLPLHGSGGLKLTADDITELVRRLAYILKTPGLTQLLADEVVKNLVFLARVAASNDVKLRTAQSISHDEDEDEDEEEEQQGRSVLEYLLARLSYILRRETSSHQFSALVLKTSSLQLFTCLATTLSAEVLSPCLQTILLPLSNITDPNIPSPYSTDEAFRNGYESLKTSSEAIMESLKKKVGTQKYSEALMRVRDGVKQRRKARSVKRKIEAVIMPEKHGENKRKRGDRKKERRKEKGADHSRRRNEF